LPQCFGAGFDSEYTQDLYFGKSFDEAEIELKRNYESLLAQKSGTGLAWNKVKDAVRDAWDQAGTT